MIRVLDMLPNASDQVQRVSLDGGVYALRARWNDRAQCFLLDLASTDGVKLVSGVPVRVGAPFSLPHATRPGMPPGLFMAGGGGDPVLGELGERVSLYYLEAVDVAEVAAS